MGSALVRARSHRGRGCCSRRVDGSADGQSGEMDVGESEPRGTHVTVSVEPKVLLRVRRGYGTTPGEASPTDQLPELSSDETPATAAFRLRLLLTQLDKGKTPAVEELKKTLAYAADVLSSQTEKKHSREDQIQSVSDEQVREWLASTFTRRDSIYSVKTLPTFRSIATAVVISKRFENQLDKNGTVMDSSISGQPTHFVHQMLDENLDHWTFDMFEAETLTGGHSLKHVALKLFHKHDLLDKFKIPPSCLNAFLSQVEMGYQRHSNPYHNSCHGADILQTVHYMIHCTGLRSWMTDLEVLAMLLAATIHDLDHTGTTNNFHIQTRSEYALCYNDRSVLENHHLCCAFKLLNEPSLNILQHLTQEDFQLLRSLVIDMVLATDMTHHFEKLKRMRLLLSSPDAVSQLESGHRSDVFCLLLHVADISHPAKAWEVHTKWTYRLMQEFFLQGDKEKALGQECSPLCDRNNTSIPESQIGFIDHIVSPSFEVCGDMLELLQPQSPVAQGSKGEVTESSATATESGGKVAGLKVWTQHFNKNRSLWKADLKEGDPRKRASTLESGRGNPIEANGPFGKPETSTEKLDPQSGTGKE